MLKIKLDRITFFFVPVIYILLPTFPSMGRGGDSLWFLLLSLVFIFSIIKINRIYFDFNSKLLFFYFSIILLLLCVSLIFDAEGGRLTSGDLMELLKLLGFFLITYGTYLAVINDGEVDSKLFFIKCAFIFIFVFILLFNILDVFGGDFFRNLSFLLYKRESQMILHNKALSPFSQIYQMGAFMVLFVVYFTIGLFKPQSGDGKIIMLMGFLGSLIILLLTQSRSSLLALIIALIVSFFFIVSFRRLFYIVSFILLIVFLIFLYSNDIYDFLKIKIPYTVYGVESIIDGRNNSANYRSEQIFWVIERSFFVVGMGVSKSYYVFESLYSLYLYRYGLIGLFLFLFLCLLNCINFYIASSRFKCYRNLLLAISIWFLCYPVTALSSAHHDTPKLALIFYGLTGLGFAVNRKSTLNL